MLFGKKDSKRKFTRLLFATDVHGSEITFKKILNSAKLYKVSVVILGGDVTGKMIIPIVQQKNGSCNAELLGEKWTINGRDQLERLEEKIRILGFYPSYTTEEELHGTQKEEVDKLFLKLMTERLQSWLKMAEERLSHTGIKFYMTGGNDDPVQVEDIIRRSRFVADPENEVVDVNGYEMISLGHSNRTPWKTPRELDEEELGEKIDALVSRVDDVHSCIFNIHVPPLESGLDECPLLDTSVYPPRPVIKGGVPVYAGAGSSAVRKAIENYQPLLGLHGHIHESRGEATIGKTICINPGSEYGEGILRAALVNLSAEGKTLLSSQFISG